MKSDAQEEERNAIQGAYLLALGQMFDVAVRTTAAESEQVAIGRFKRGLEISRRVRDACIDILSEDTR